MSEAETVAQRWQADLWYLAKLVGATIALFALAGLLAGVSNNVIAGFLVRMMFYAAIFGLLTLALNLHWGYTGMFNIGVAGFMAVGMYVMAFLTASPEATPAGLGLPVVVGALGGIVAAGAMGAIVALPALRVRADYFAIITLGFSEIVRLTLLSDLLQGIRIGDTVYGTGGANGIGFASVSGLVTAASNLPIASQAVGGLELLAGLIGIRVPVVNRFLYVVMLILFVLVYYVLLSRVGHSPFGRVLKAIREDELVAQSLGKNTDRVKITAFALGSALMGLGGILWLGEGSYVSPQSFKPIITFYVFVALILGGSGSNTGSVVGGFAFAAFLYEGPRFIRTLVRTNIDIQAPSTIYDALLALLGGDVIGTFGFFVESLDKLRWIAIGLVLVVLMIKRPEGLFGDRKEIAAAVPLSARGDDRE